MARPTDDRGSAGSPPRPPGRAATIGLGVLAGALLAGILALAAWPRSSPPLPTLGTVPEFSLTTERGETIRARDLRGQVWAAGFVFTRCTTICPVITGRMRRVQEFTADLGPALRLVSFSVDPEHDTPERLATYARENGADARRWVFLTGAYDALQKTVVDGFKVLMERAPPKNPEALLHGSHVVLVDGAGRIRGYYEAAEPDCAERVARDARRLVESPDWATDAFTARR